MTGVRVHVVCEGQTEETFIKKLLVLPFSKRGIFLYPRLLGQPGHKGGRVEFSRVFCDVRNNLMGDTAAWCTTFFDFYKMDMDFPGRREAATLPSAQKRKECVENAMVDELRKRLGDNSLRRFIPYVQMHEFEALLFSDPEAAARGWCLESSDHDEVSRALQEIRCQVSTPEDIDDGESTSPARRIERIFDAYVQSGSYEHLLHGIEAAEKVGLESMRTACPLFSAWVARLESLVPQTFELSEEGAES